MRIWRLYSSGICYGQFQVAEGEIRHRWLDANTAEYREERKLDEEDNRFYQQLANMDVLDLLSRLEEYDLAFADGETPSGRPKEESDQTAGTLVTLSQGEIYQKMDAHNYCQRMIRFPRNVLYVNGRVRGFTCPSRERVHVLVEQGYENQTVIRRWKEEYPEEVLHPISDLGETEVVTRDGVPLSTAVLIPADVAEPVPTILVRTPYGKEGDILNYLRYVHRGYAVVIQDVRGRNKSGGEWLPNSHEVEDGDDTLNWIAAQPWSNGKVGTVGGSYLGYVQWAAAASGNPHLTTMISVVTAGSAFCDLPRKGGAFVSGMMAWAFAVSKREFHPELMMRDDWDEILNIRPLEDIPKKALGYEIPFLTTWLNHMDCDELWKKSDWKKRSSGVKIPALIMSGWFDDDGMGTTEALDLTADHGDTMRKVILGPWQHGGNSRYDIHGMVLGQQALKMDIDLTFFRWFDYHLRGRENGIDRLPDVEYYTLGEERWKTASDWPVPETEAFSLYLTDGETASDNGGLRFEPAARAGEDSYDYDPEDPALCIIDMSENEVGVPENYTEQDLRPDVLCYDTPPLEEPVTLTGDFSVELYISSDAPDTDFVVRINDVDEHGTSIKLADGVLSARYRDGFETSRMMKPGQVYKLVIRTSKVSAMFKRGHRIRLTVTSSAKNWIFPNSNTEGGFNSQETRIAHNTVHHGGIYPSRVTGRRER